MKSMSKVVVMVSQIAFLFAVVYGFYIIFHGHLTPGGGFQGGAILVSAAAMILVAFGRKDVMKLMPQNLNHIFVMLESFMIISIGMLLFLPEAAKVDGSISAVIYNAIAGPSGLFGYKIAAGINDGFFNTGGLLGPKSIVTGFEVLAALYIIIKVMYRAHEEDFSQDDSGLMNPGGDDHA